MLSNDERSSAQRNGCCLSSIDAGKNLNIAIRIGNWINNGKQPFKEYCNTPMIQDFAKLYTNFRKQYPEVTEMRFYTDELVKVEDD